LSVLLIDNIYYYWVKLVLFLLLSLMLDIIKFNHL